MRTWLKALVPTQTIIDKLVRTKLIYTIGLYSLCTDIDAVLQENNVFNISFEYFIMLMHIEKMLRRSGGKVHQLIFYVITRKHLKLFPLHLSMIVAVLLIYPE